MAYGIHVKDENGNDFIGSYAPFNYVKTIPVREGTHTLSFPELGDNIDVSMHQGDSLGENRALLLTSVTVSGNTLRYTAQHYAEPLTVMYGAVFRIYAKR